MAGEHIYYKLLFWSFLNPVTGECLIWALYLQSLLFPVFFNRTESSQILTRSGEDTWWVFHVRFWGVTLCANTAASVWGAARRDWQRQTRACEQDNRGEQRLSSSSTRFQHLLSGTLLTPSPSALSSLPNSCVTYGFISGLSKNSHNSCVVCCHVGSPELPQTTLAVDKQPDDIWTDLEQHITFHFPDTPWPTSHQGPSSSFVPHCGPDRWVYVDSDR